MIGKRVAYNIENAYGVYLDAARKLNVDINGDDNRFTSTNPQAADVSFTITPGILPDTVTCRRGCSGPAGVSVADHSHAEELRNSSRRTTFG